MPKNGKGYNGKYTAAQFIDAIPGTGGVVSLIAERVGCHWNTAKKYIEKYPTAKQAWKNERSRINDKAQHNIITAITDGDLQMSKWWLSVLDDEFKPKTKQEITGPEGGPQEVKYSFDFSSLTDDELETLAKIARKITTGD